MLDLKEERGDAGLEPKGELQRVLRAGSRPGEHRKEPEHCSFSWLKKQKTKGKSNTRKCKNATCLLQEENGEKDPLIDIFKVSLFPT